MIQKSGKRIFVPWAVAGILKEPYETEYGKFQYGGLDLEGHPRLFARHTRDVSPAAWGAIITTPLP